MDHQSPFPSFRRCRNSEGDLQRSEVLARAKHCAQRSEAGKPPLFQQRWVDTFCLLHIWLGKPSPVWSRWFLDALASLAFKWRVSEWVSEWLIDTFSDYQSILSLHSIIQSFQSLQSLQSTRSTQSTQSTQSTLLSVSSVSSVLAVSSVLSVLSVLSVSSVLLVSSVSPVPSVFSTLYSCDLWVIHSIGDSFAKSVAWSLRACFCGIISWSKSYVADLYLTMKGTLIKTQHIVNYKLYKL